MNAASHAQIVFCTCPADGTATRLAKLLVESRLAACVNILPKVTSVYRWQREIVDDEESLLVIKTLKNQFEALERAIVAAHPYELPEIVAVPIEQGLAPYLGWLETEIAPLEQ